MNKNILELCLSPNLGGLELFAANLHIYLEQKTNSTIIIEKNSKLDYYIKSEKKIYLKRNKLFPIFPALKLAKHVDKHNIDIIHLHWSRDMLTAVLTRVLSKRKPKIILSRHMGMTRFKDDFYHKWLYKNIHTIHAVAQHVKEQLEKYIPKDVLPNINVIHPGTSIPKINKNRVEILKSQYALKNEFVVGIIGRIEDAKGQHIVIDAIAQLENLDLKALIVGDTMNEEYLKSLKQQTIDSSIEKKVIFTGFTKEVNEHIQLCDAIILATEDETFGLIIIEAMANKKCVIATNNLGPTEIINDGINGLLFDRTSSDLANKLTFIYTNKKLKNQLAEQSYHTATNKFEYNQQTEKLYKILERM